MAPPRVIAGRLLGVLLAVAVVAGGVLLLRGAVPCEALASQPACDVALQPGPTEDTFGLITISGAEVFTPTDGSLSLTTVSVQDDLGLVEWVNGRMSRSVEVVPREQIYPPDIDREELNELNAAAMRDSQQVATIVALERLGYELDPDGALIVAVQTDAVSDELAIGDVITAVDGNEVRESTEAVDAIRSRAIGDSIELELRGTDGERRVIEVELGANPEDPELPYIGLLLTTDLDLPVDIQVDAGTIGGPSAGLVFTLSLLELLGPEDLLDGRVVAATGTMGRDGTVGAVGGVPQKLLGASTPRDGSPPAEVFLVPRDNLDVALNAAVAEDLLVVPVGSLEEALEALEDLREGREPVDSRVLAAS